MNYLSRIKIKIPLKLSIPKNLKLLEMNVGNNVNFVLSKY